MSDMLGAASSSSAHPSPPKPKLAKNKIKPPHPDKTSAAVQAESLAEPEIPAEMWRQTVLDVLPPLESTSQSIVDRWYSSGVWEGPVHASLAEREEGDLCSANPRSEHKDDGKTKNDDHTSPSARAITADRDGSLWTDVTAHSHGFDVDSVRAAGSRIIHTFLSTICAPSYVLLCGTRFSNALYPACTCHSKAKADDFLRIALEVIGLPNFNVHELDRVIFVFEMYNRWFVLLFTPQLLVVYDPAGYSRLEPEVVSKLADHVANAFLSDACRWSDRKNVPDSLDTLIIAPDIATDPSGSLVLVCGAVELLVNLRPFNHGNFAGVEVGLWFLSESIHRDLTYEHCNHLLNIALDEVEGKLDKGNHLAGSTSAGLVSKSKARPRLNAPKLPFKAKRRVKRKTPEVAVSSPSPHWVSPVLASALQSANKKSLPGTKLSKVLYDRIVWTCNSGHLPNGAVCTCDCLAEYLEGQSI
ncbi:hypothetical protein CC85DRAFT_301834 [Cutaneotrichosporon oleaginosum]|uniref:Uncharacterized protein n=1 Tax=Cutaneotrichosporon oleaginosum TaxID=879819 RepID=A0A0J0XPQ5_9TREE|nr:uncharacterized protein CC85DRAFT_301834 [Cutaneotrichosporon oleaginosum]KLT43047.1 hypothetical protein CC85DRAFT_301834 [Cutaneotrichosporon oleaginosum]TXT11752.1 hypothetical protein COLE_02162 [Cutaneotrichosporon oleaginosum]